MGPEKQRGHPSFAELRAMSFRTDAGPITHEIQILTAGPVLYGTEWLRELVPVSMGEHVDHLCCVTEDAWPAIVDGLPSLLLVQEFDICRGDDFSDEAERRLVGQLQWNLLPDLRAALRDQCNCVLGVTTDETLSSFGRPALVLSVPAEHTSRADVERIVDTVRTFAYPQ